MRNKSIELKLNTQKHASFSVIAFALAIVGLVFFVWAVIVSAFYNEGTMGGHTYVGLLEIVSMMSSLSGFVLGVMGEFMTEDKRIFSHIAIPLHVLLLIGHMMVVSSGY